MRPIRLDIVGFSAFREPTVVDFADVDLVAFVGPTGAGKSSIIDAITFALYGSVSRYDHEGLVAPVIHQLATEARVSLEFEVGGERYVAVRVVRRNARGATTREARLEHVVGDGTADVPNEVLAGSAPEMAAAVQRLIGLDFGQFTKTVVLPQGEFAAFLHERKADRQRLLRQLLDLGVYERMGALARERAKYLGLEAGGLTDQLERLPAMTDDELADRTRRLGELVAARAAVAGHLEALVAVDAGLEEITGRGRALRSQSHALAAIAVPDGLDQLGSRLATARAAEVAADGALAAARAERDRAQAAVDDGADLVALNRSLDAARRRGQLVSELAGLTVAVEAAQAAATATAAADAAASADYEAADQAYGRARDAAGASALVATLAVGERCPVCRQVVGELPHHDPDAELAAATAGRDGARKARDAAAAAASAARDELRGLEARRQDRTGELDQLTERFGADLDETALSAGVEAAQAAVTRQKAAVAAVVDAEREVAAARGAVEQLVAEESSLRSGFVDARDTVASRRPPTPAGASLVEDWAELAAWAGAEVATIDAEIAGTLAEHAVLRDRREAVIAAIAEACAPVGIEVDRSSIDEHFGERMAQEEVRAEHAVEEAARVREARADLERRLADLAERRAVAGELGQLLSATGFERWLMEEAMDDIVDRASERLGELSASQYSLESDDGGFFIRDHRNADERRDVRTLSGGETFLASLALALALADHVAEMSVEGSPQLDSMFLDEGFGTLDPDTLDTVASAIEELGSAGRMIGVVTHIRELADRMPVRFEVSIDERSARVARVER